MENKELVKQQQTEDRKTIEHLEWLVKKTTIYANIAICAQVFGIIVAVVAFFFAKDFNKKQIMASQKNELTKNAVDVVNKIYTKEFLESFGRLDYDKPLDNSETKSDFILVLNTYYLTAIVYNSKIADTLLIRESIKQGIMKFVGSRYYKNEYLNDINVNSAKKAINQMIKYFPNKNEGL